MCLGWEAGQGKKELIKMFVLFLLIYEQSCLHSASCVYNVIFAFHIVVIMKQDLHRMTYCLTEKLDFTSEEMFSECLTVQSKCLQSSCDVLTGAGPLEEPQSFLVQPMPVIPEWLQSLMLGQQAFSNHWILAWY